MRKSPTRHPSSRPEPTRADEARTVVSSEYRPSSLKKLRGAVNACRRCPLWREATQGVPGEGPLATGLMLVGEAPGDAEDIAGRPFVGPAGRLLDSALEEAGIDRRSTFVTNAVKHFKYERRGKRRLHSKPNAGEIRACRWWLSQELELVAPRLTVALGATAARTLMGKAVTISATRGTILTPEAGPPVMVTIHPSYLLRIPDDSARKTEYSRLVRELGVARAWLRGRPR
jgi:uracil-DNA glycosylase family protein